MLNSNQHGGKKGFMITCLSICCIVVVEIRCSEPNQKVIELYDAIKYKYAPFKKKKSVVHKSELEELKIIEQQLFLSD